MKYIKYTGTCIITGDTVRGYLSNKDTISRGETSVKVHPESIRLRVLGKNFTQVELEHILFKVKVVKMSDNLRELMLGDWYDRTYIIDEDGEDFLDKYTGKVVNAYTWAGDWWICEDDNWPINKSWFEIVED